MLRTRLRLGLLIALFAAVLDQATKWFVLAVIMQPPQIIPITPFFNLLLTWNRGISFGLFNSASPLGTWIFSGIALAIVGVLIVWLKREHSLAITIAIGVIIGGAIGNVIDRLRFGAVADFLDVHIAGFHWPAFNISDSFITMGALYLIVESLFQGRAVQDAAEDDKT